MPAAAGGLGNTGEGWAGGGGRSWLSASCIICMCTPLQGSAAGGRPLALAQRGCSDESPGGAAGPVAATASCVADRPGAPLSTRPTHTRTLHNTQLLMPGGQVPATACRASLCCNINMSYQHFGGCYPHPRCLECVRHFPFTARTHAHTTLMHHACMPCTEPAGSCTDAASVVLLLPSALIFCHPGRCRASWRLKRRRAPSTIICIPINS